MKTAEKPGKSMLLRVCSLVSVFSFLLPMVFAGSFIGPLDLTILHTSDYHGYYQPFDCASGTKMGGYAKVKAYKDNLEMQGRKVLLLSSGDVVQGTMAYRVFGRYPDIELMNVSGYAAMTLGNHEFDGKEPVLLDSFKAANFDILSANLKLPKNSRLKEMVKDFKIMDVSVGSQTLRMAFIGATDEMMIDTFPTGFLPGIVVEDAFKTLRRVLPHVKARGVQAIFLLSHLGWVREIGVADAFPEIFGILGGHTHLFVNPPLIRDIPNGHQFFSEPGQYGQAIDRYDLRFTLVNGAVHQEVVGAELVEMNNTLPEDPEIKAIVDEFNEEVSEKTKGVIGEALVHLEGDRPMIRVQETNLGNLIADSMLKVLPADFALTNGGGIRTSILKGPIIIGDCLKVLPFENYLVKLKMTGANVYDLFEQIENGILFFPGFGAFPHVSKGFRVEIGPDGSHLFLHGKPIERDKIYYVTTSDFLANGGNGLTEFQNCIGSEATGILLSEALIELVKEMKKVSAGVEGRITINRARKGINWRVWEESHQSFTAQLLGGFSWKKAAKGLYFQLRVHSGKDPQPTYAMPSATSFDFPFEYRAAPPIETK